MNALTEYPSEDMVTLEDQNVFYSVLAKRQSRRHSGRPSAYDYRIIYHLPSP